jgi:hypothetical protein
VLVVWQSWHVKVWQAEVGLQAVITGARLSTCTLRQSSWCSPNGASVARKHNE